jgi:hypothetical protein
MDNRPVDAIPAESRRGRLLSESIALAEAHGSGAIPDEGFARDVAKGIAEHSEPWTPPNWE